MTEQERVARIRRLPSTPTAIVAVIAAYGFLVCGLNGVIL